MFTKMLWVAGMFLDVYEDVLGFGVFLDVYEDVLGFGVFLDVYEDVMGCWSVSRCL